MKIALISDIHSNLHALYKALETADKEGVEEVYCLGDIVGYGADPGPCVDLVMRYCAAAVLGNHDEAIVFGRGMDVLPQSGQVAAKHNREKLTDTQLEYLRGLPYMVEAHNFTIVHAAPMNPHHYTRLESYFGTVEQFEHFSTDFCFVGHTHLPAIMADKLGVTRVRPGNRYLINVGSVGQPRDNNPRLGFGIFDTETLSYNLMRVPYNVEGAAARIIEEGLPEALADRLKVGK